MPKIFENNIFRVLVSAAIIISSHGCATLKNTKIPESFSELGYCRNCKRVMALDGLSEGTKCFCPNCDTEFVVKDAKYRLKRRCADLKNQKTAGGVLTVAMMGASVAGAVFGIPIPPPPVCEDTFRPYEMPEVVTCKKASPVDQPAYPIPPAELRPHGAVNIPSAGEAEPEEVTVENSDAPQPEGGPE